MIDVDRVLKIADLQDAKKIAIMNKTRERLTDAHAPGLRVIAYPSGQVTFSVEYRIPGIKTRMNVTLGYWPDTMSIHEAREVAETVRELGERGVDVQLGLHTRLVQELKRDGVNWRPTLCPPAASPPKRPSPRRPVLAPAPPRKVAKK